MVDVRSCIFVAGFVGSGWKSCEVRGHVLDIGIAKFLRNASHDFGVWSTGPRAGTEKFQLGAYIVRRLTGKIGNVGRMLRPACEVT